MKDEELQLLRNEIDRIDAELIALLNARYKAVESIGEYKRERHLPVADVVAPPKIQICLFPIFLISSSLCLYSEANFSTSKVILCMAGPPFPK